MTTHTKRNVSEDDDVVHEVCLNYAVRFKLYIMCVCVHTQIIEREYGGIGKVFTIHICIRMVPFGLLTP